VSHNEQTVFAAEIIQRIQLDHPDMIDDRTANWSTHILDNKAHNAATCEYCKPVKETVHTIIGPGITAVDSVS